VEKKEFLVTFVAVTMMGFSTAALAQISRTYKVINVGSGLNMEDYGWETRNGATVDLWSDNGGGANQRRITLRMAMVRTQS
jgi:hypothetical protein